MPAPCPLLAQARGTASGLYYSVSLPPTVPEENLHLYCKTRETYAVRAVGPFFPWRNEAYIPKQKIKGEKKKHTNAITLFQSQSLNHTLQEASLKI